MLAPVWSIGDCILARIKGRRGQEESNTNSGPKKDLQRGPHNEGRKGPKPKRRRRRMRLTRSPLFGGNEKKEKIGRVGFGHVRDSNRESG